MKVKWSAKATRDLAAACDYVAIDNEAAAGQLLKVIREVTNRTLLYPRVGREGRVKNTRELVIPGTPYIVAYRVIKDGSVQVLSVLHARRRWPEAF